MVVTMETFVVGQVNIDRSNGMVRGISQVCSDLDYGDFENWSPDPTGIVTRIDGGGTTDGAFPKVLDTFTANPGKRIAVVSLNDDMGLAALAAARELGIEDMVAYASQGADATIHDEIRNNPQYIGSTGYFPETYGNYVIPAILAMIAGDPVPDPLFVEHKLVSKDNIDQFYPSDGAAAPAAAASDMPAVCQGYDGTGITIGYGDLTAGIPFVTQVLDNLMAVAEACNVEVMYADNNLDGETALENARTFTLAGVDGVIEFQIDATIEGAICDELRANDPNLPVIAIDIAHPSCALFFGADNGYAGELAGQALGEWAQENWGCEIDMVVTMETFVVGQVNIDRSNGMVRGISQVCSDLDYGDFENWSPDPTGIVTRIDGGGTTDGAFPKSVGTRSRRIRVSGSRWCPSTMTWVWLLWRRPGSWGSRTWWPMPARVLTPRSMTRSGTTRSTSGRRGTSPRRMGTT